MLEILSNKKLAYLRDVARWLYATCSEDKNNKTHKFSLNSMETMISSLYRLIEKNYLI